jgi:hypothetical protein
MPFDDPLARVEIDVANREEIAILDGMARRLATPDLWCKGSLASGVSRCLIGALNEEDHGNYNYRWGRINLRFDRVSARVVYHRLNELAGWWPDRSENDQAVGFNNADTTTHADVLGLIQRARASFE